MKTIILAMIKKLGSQLLMSLLSEIIGILNGRDDNTVGKQSVSDIAEIVARNTISKA